LRYVLLEAANTGIRFDERLGSIYHRIAPRRGPQKAKVAVAKEILVIMWYMLTNNEPYRTMKIDLVERKYKRMEETATRHVWNGSAKQTMTGSSNETKSSTIAMDFAWELEQEKLFLRIESTQMKRF
jgi:hypothetical protein